MILYNNTLQTYHNSRTRQRSENKTALGFVKGLPFRFAEGPLTNSKTAFRLSRTCLARGVSVAF